MNTQPRVLLVPLLLLLATAYLLAMPAGGTSSPAEAAMIIETEDGRSISTLPTPAPTATPAPASERITKGFALVSHYRPELGGTNCWNFVNGECISLMASGLKWQDHYGVAAACPRDLPFWTKIRFQDGEEFTCLDRGTAIVRKENGDFWVDLLVQEPKYPFGWRTPVEIVAP